VRIPFAGVQIPLDCVQILVSRFSRKEIILANPSNPQKYFIAQGMQAFLTTDLDSDLSPLDSDADSVFGNQGIPALFLRGDYQNWARADACDFLDRGSELDPSQWETQLDSQGNMNFFANVCLYNPTGWGSSPEVLIQGPSALGQISAKGYLFGTYDGDFYYKTAIPFSLYYPASGAPPLFPFDPTLLPLYSISSTGVAGGDTVLWSFNNALVSFPGPGQIDLQFPAKAGQEDNFDVFDPSGVEHKCGNRSVKLIYLRIGMTLSDLRLIEGRAIPLTFTVNGGQVAQMSVLRFSRAPFLPTLLDAHVSLDRTADCDLLTGSLEQTFSLFDCEGPGAPIHLRLFYSSENSIYYRDAAMEQDPTQFLWAPFGHGWGFSYGMRVIGPVLGQERLDNQAKSSSDYLIQDSWGRLSVFHQEDPTQPIYTPQTRGWWASVFGGNDFQVQLMDTGGGYVLSAGDESDVYTFDSDGKLIQIRSPHYATPTSIVWSGANFTVTDATGRTAQFQTNGDGQVTQVTDPAQQLWNFTYDGPSLTAIISPLGTVASFAYDSSAFVMAQKTSGAQNRVVNYAYLFGDAASRQLWGTLSTAVCQDPSRGGALQHTFAWADVAGARSNAFCPNQFTVAHTNPRRIQTSYTVTISPGQIGDLDQGCQLDIANPDQSSLSLTFNVLTANIATATNASGLTAYDDQGFSFVNRTGTTFVYDPNHPRRPTSVTDANGVTETYQYIDLPNATGLVNTVTRAPQFAGQPPLVITYQWTGPGDMSVETETGGEENQFDYYSMAPFIGLKSQVTHCVGQGQVQGVDQFQYDAFGRVTQVTGSESARQFAYDCFGRLIQETETTGAGSHSQQITRDIDGNPLTITDSDGWTKQFTYDLQGSLIHTTFTDSAETIEESWTRDPNGNVLQMTGPGGPVSFQYDSMDRPQQIVVNQVTGGYQYDGNGRLQQVTEQDASGAVQTTGYQMDGDDNLQQITYPEVPTPDGSGTTWRPTSQVNYYGNGRAQKVTRDVAPGTQAVSQFDLDGNGRPYQLERQTAQGSYKTLEALDFLGRLSQQQGPQFDFGASSGTVSSADIQTGEARTARSQLLYAWDCRNRLTSVQNGDGSTVVQLTYNDANAVTTIQTPDPQSPDAEQLRAAESRNYDDRHRETAIIDARGAQTTLGYDDQNNVTQVTWPSSWSESRTYDSLGQVLSVTRSAPGLPSLITDYAYDMVGGPNSVVHTNTRPAGSQSVQSYAMVYDAMGRLIQKTDPLQRTASMTYDGYGNLTGVTVGGQTVQYTYDALRRMAGKSFQSTGETATYAYDGLGNMTFAENAVSRSTWKYNECGMLIQRTVFFKAANVTKQILYTYDQFGNLFKRTDGDGNVTRYQYDAQDRLVGVYLGADTTPIVTQAFTVSGMIKQRTLVRGGFTTSFAYDTAGDIVSLQHANPTTTVAQFTYQRDSVGRVLNVARTGTTQTTALAYDPGGRLAHMTISSGAATPDRDEQYRYDSIGNRLTNWLPDRVRIGAYDAANQLVRIDEALAAPIDRTTLTATSDSDAGAGFEAANAINGDRTDSLAPGVGWISDANDVEHTLTLTMTQPAAVAIVELVFPSAPGPAVGLFVDVEQNGVWAPATILDIENGKINGSGFDTIGSDVRVYIAPASATAVRIRREPGGGFTTAPIAQYLTSLAIIEVALYPPGSSTAYAYDGLGSRQQAGAWTYQHDLEGRLIRATGPTVDIEYEYGADGRLAVRTNHISGEVQLYLSDGINLYAEYDGQGNPIRTYLLAPGQAPLGFLVPASPNPALHLFLTDERDSICHVISDANLLENSYTYDSWGNVLSQQETVPQPLRFMSKRLDSDTGIYAWHMRQYDPATGVYLEKDPVSGAANPYTFLANNPVGMRDTLGLNWLTDKLSAAWETAKEYPGALYEDFASGAARDRLATFTVSAAGGVKDATVAAATGLVHAVAHPVETAERTVEGIVHTIANPGEVFAAISQSVDHLLWLAANDPDQFAEAVGRLTGEQMVQAVVGRASAGLQAAAAERLAALIKRSNIVAKLQSCLGAAPRNNRKPWDPFTYSDYKKWLGEGSGSVAAGDYKLPRRPPWSQRVLDWKNRKYRYWIGGGEHHIAHGVSNELQRSIIEKMVNTQRAEVVHKWLEHVGFPAGVYGGSVEKAAAAFYYKCYQDVDNLKWDFGWLNSAKGGAIGRAKQFAEGVNIMGKALTRVEDWVVRRKRWR
jgi:RHS repeat-associated protein